MLHRVCLAIMIGTVSVSAQWLNYAATNLKATAPLDLTGYGVSIVAEDWRYRMLTRAPARMDTEAAKGPVFYISGDRKDAQGDPSLERDSVA
jgi:hypothetical protein